MIKKMKHIVCLLFVVISFQLFGQDSITISLSHYPQPDFLQLDTNLKTKYPFIHFEKNQFQFFTDTSENWKRLFHQMDSMITLKDRKLNFYHIGGSHLQADIYTHDVRTKLQTTWDSLPGERGFLFPFNLAKTNNPANYEFSSANKWKAYRSVTQNKCELDYGLLGAVITSSDSCIIIHFQHNRTEVKPKTSQIKIFHNKGALPFLIDFPQLNNYIFDQSTDTLLGITSVSFTQEIDSFDIQFSRKTAIPAELQLSGFELINKQPGISYTSIGVNGAGLYTYLDCGNFGEQLRQAPPDFFVFSVGTNDGNVPYDAFKPEKYKANLEQMMKIVYEANPNCAILLTVPNDSYYQRKYLNRNIARERDMIIELAKQYQVPIWDMYGIMGELGSSKQWQLAGLMQGDKVHFTGTGYHLKGSLFFDAFEKWLKQMNYLENQKKGDFKN
jgi:hypothetical protein